MNSGLECNIEQTFNAFMDLTQKEMNSTVRRALRAGAKKLQEQTRSNIKSGLKTRNNSHWYDGKPKVYSDSIEDAVRISKIEGDFETELSIPVHIYGTRASDSGTFRARFLEKGTKERYAKKARNRNHELIQLRKPKYLGSIKGRWFFRDAQNQVIPNLPTVYLQEINKTINKLNNTKI